MTSAMRHLELLSPVGLTEIDSLAALQTRKDRKYLVAVERLDGLWTSIRDHARVLTIDDRRVFRYESIYFDTPALTSYFAAARRRPRRFKVRTRTYLDDGSCWLEVKTRDGRGNTVKNRLPYEVTSRRCLSEVGQEFVERFPEIGPLGRNLQPSLLTRYHRRTLFMPVSQTRVTIDTDLECVAVDEHGTLLSDWAILETKGELGTSPFERLLWRSGHRPVAFSKYGIGIACSRPDLSANKWNRTLRDYFAWEPARLKSSS